MNNPMTFISLGALFSILATLCLFQAHSLSTTRAVNNATEEQKTTLAKYKKEDMAERKRQADEYISTYRDTLNKIIKGEIPMPPNFVSEQKRNFEAYTKDIEAWARELGSLRGVEREKLELDHLALEARAAQIDAQIRPHIKPVITTFGEVISVLNKEKSFGGKIKLEVLEIKNTVVTVHSPYKRGGRSTQDFMRISFPNGKQWGIVLLSICVSPDALEGMQKGLNVLIRAERIGASIFIERDGIYRFSPRGDSVTKWPDEISNKTGGIGFLQTVVKNLFQQEMMLAQ
ncbi:MAG: hypothetical protein NG740_03215 [Omnitrophica bacterium]|nr:hypothetical protein [Candidatus Omnitrophota bacterium]